MKKNRKKIAMWSLLGLMAAAVIVLGGIKLYRIHLRDQCGILLAFDDYSEVTWEKYFDLFDEYDVKVTFFINAGEPTQFCYDAIERGHEIAYHTKSHARLTELTQEEIYEQAIAPIEIFREKGIELKNFAYPYGIYSAELNELLLQHYNVLRGALEIDPHIKHDLKKGFVESMSLDNVNYNTQEAYENKVGYLLETIAEQKGVVISFYSHAIDNGGPWCVSEEKLIFLFEKAKELGLRFYTFAELQED